jgi:hypothetical protein
MPGQLVSSSLPWQPPQHEGSGCCCCCQPWGGITSSRAPCMRPLGVSIACPGEERALLDGPISVPHPHPRLNHITLTQHTCKPPLLCRLLAPDSPQQSLPHPSYNHPPLAHNALLPPPRPFPPCSRAPSPSFVPRPGHNHPPPALTDCSVPLSSPHAPLPPHPPSLCRARATTTSCWPATTPASCSTAAAWWPATRPA